MLFSAEIICSVKRLDFFLIVTLTAFNGSHGACTYARQRLGKAGSGPKSRSKAVPSRPWFLRAQHPGQLGPAWKGQRRFGERHSAGDAPPPVLLVAGSSCTSCTFQEIVGDGMGAIKQSPRQILTTAGIGSITR